MGEVALQDLTTLLQGVAALALGGIVGYERERAGKNAGLRTHMLVAFASFLFVKIGEFLTVAAAADMPGLVQGDPVRVVQAIVTGVAFIGAGVVFRDPDHLGAHGLTTAASLFAVSPIGIAVAAERYVLALGAAVMIVIVLRVIRILEGRLGIHHPGEKQ
jgi:putative Mg2+ transporter-C (MgtC) family protein